MFQRLNRTVPFAVFALALTTFASGISATMIDIPISPITVTPGEIGVTVLGMLANNTSDTAFLNGDNENLAASFAVPGSITDLFLTTAPLSLSNLATTGFIELFTFDVPADAPVGTFDAGLFQVLGGFGTDNQNNFDVIGTANLQVTVTPEPGGFADGAIGVTLLGIAQAIRRARRRVAPKTQQ
jgi:hypothetical protein